METKKINWDYKFGDDYQRCNCGAEPIGSIEKIHGEFLARLFTGNYSYLRSAELAREWVENEFQEFIKKRSK